MVWKTNALRGLLVAGWLGLQMMPRRSLRAVWRWRVGSASCQPCCASTSACLLPAPPACWWLAVACAHGGGPGVLRSDRWCSRGGGPASRPESVAARLSSIHALPSIRYTATVIDRSLLLLAALGRCCCWFGRPAGLSCLRASFFLALIFLSSHPHPIRASPSCTILIFASQRGQNAAPLDPGGVFACWFWSLRGRCSGSSSTVAAHQPSPGWAGLARSVGADLA